jgi:hypothetical protein
LVQYKALPKYVFWMAVLTPAYLIIELAFNARLLDVTAGTANQQEIDHIETWGRLISGAALTIGIWGIIFARFNKSSATDVVPALLISTIFCFGAAYLIQEAIIQSVVRNSSGPARRAATTLVLTTHMIAEGNIILHGLEIGEDRFSSPQGKAFLSLLPFVALSTSDLDKKIGDALRQMVETRVTRVLGSAGHHYNNVVLPSIREITDSYNQYARGVNSYSDAIISIPNRQQEYWDSYVRKLREDGRGMRPDTVPAAYHVRVRRMVTERGLDIPLNWHPNDRATFNDAVRRKVEREAAAAYDSGMQNSLGTILPKNLDKNSFAGHPAIQRRWREATRMPNSIPLTIDMTAEKYAADYHPIILHEEVQRQLEPFIAPADTFEGEGVNAARGRNAMKALAVPPIALGFSLIGALVHLFKTTNYLARIVFPIVPGALRTPILLSATIALAGSAFLFPNAVSTSPAFEYLSARTRDSLGLVPAESARWVIQAQPYFYPVNESIRVQLGATFGYNPR